MPTVKDEAWGAQSNQRGIETYLPQELFRKLSWAQSNQRGIETEGAAHSQGSVGQAQSNQRGIETIADEAKRMAEEVGSIEPAWD